MSWVDLELEEIDLGDQRLNRRATKILDTLGLAPGRTIPQAFQAWNEVKACYNFFNNGQVSDEKLLEPHIAKTVERIKEHSVVLLLSDTSELDYTTKEAMVGRERLSNKKKGLWIHSTIAVTPERLMLGVVGAHFWSRQTEVAKDEAAYRTARDNAPIEEKESYRWIQSYKRACEIAKETPETQIINITDREGDIIELYQHALKQGCKASFIIRSQYDRIVRNEDSETETADKKLRQKLNQSPALGELEFTIAARGPRQARKVKQTLKATTVTLQRKSKNIKVKVNAVMSIEENPPGGESPLVWVFITDLPIKTFEDVTRIISYYLCRWEVELFFKVLKSGCKIEERQLQTTERMKGLIAIFMILSWRVLFTMMLGRICSEMSSSDLFDEAEWKSVYKILNRKKALPRKPPRLGEFIKMVATLGGYVEQKEGEPPGVKVMWKGMARMIDFSIAWEAFGG